MITEAYVQQMAEINRRHIYHYLISSNIGDIHVIEHEDSAFGLVRDLITDSNDKAEKTFKRTVAKVVKEQ